ncbi:MAG: hypothetical protein QOI61_2379, partial [Actinomycetota bacterium]
MARLGGYFGHTCAHDSGPDNTDTLDRHGARGYSPVATVLHVKHPGLHADVRRERLLAKARGRILDIATEPGWMTRSDLAPHSFDTIVCTFVLCSVADVHGALLRIGELLA